MPSVKISLPISKNYFTASPRYRIRLLYDPLLSHKVFMMNGATLGFYLNNKI